MSREGSWINFLATESQPVRACPEERLVQKNKGIHDNISFMSLRHTEDRVVEKQRAVKITLFPPQQGPKNRKWQIKWRSG